MNAFRFLCLLVLSAAVHLYLIWMVVGKRPPELRLAQGEVSVRFSLHPGGIPREGVQAGDVNLKTVAQQVEETTAKMPAFSKARTAVEQLPLPTEQESLLPQHVRTEKLPVEPPTAAEVLPPPSPLEKPNPEGPPQPAKPTVTKTEAARSSTAGNPAASQRPQGVRKAASLVGNPKPVYPREAQVRGMQGTVTVWLHVSADGKVVDARVHESSGYAILDSAALQFARTLRLNPAQEGDKPVGSYELLPVTYQLYNP